jgi:hypothetical protein
MSALFIYSFFNSSFLNNWIINDGFKIFMFEIFTFPTLLVFDILIALKNIPQTIPQNKNIKRIYAFILILFVLGLMIFTVVGFALNTKSYLLLLYFFISLFTKYIVINRIREIKEIQREFALMLFIITYTLFITVIIGFIVMLIIGIEAILTDYKMLSVFGFLYFISLMISNWYGEKNIDKIVKFVLKNPV